MLRWAGFSAWLVGCASTATPAPPAPEAPAPIAHVALGGDWVIVEEDRDEIVVRWRDTADGVRINLARTAEGRLPGVAPIRDGRTLELRRGSTVVPLFQPSFAGLTAATIEVQGPDLLVRLEGPPLSSLSRNPEAPEDPALAWVRVRPRGETWRLALRGLLVWTLPGEGLEVHHRGDSFDVDSAWGRFEDVADDAPARRGHHVEVWQRDTGPSLDLAQPYPKLGVTWRP